MLTQIDFNRLKVFYFIYSSMSIAGAAKQLNITRSAVSQNLKKLEGEMKTVLFTRMHKSLVPTLEADRLFDIMQPFWAQLETAALSIKQGKLKPTGLIRLGAPIEFGNNYLQKIIADFRRLYPEVSFALTLGDSDELLSKLKSGQMDFAIIDMFINQGRYLGNLGAYSIDPLIDEEIVLISSTRYYTTRLQRDFSLSNLVQQDYIAYHKTNPVLTGWFKHHFNNSNLKLNVVLTVNSVQAVISAVENDAGLGIVPSHVVYDKITAGSIIQVTPPTPNIINKMSLAQLQDKIPNLAEKKLREFLRKGVRKEQIFKKFSK